MTYDKYKHHRHSLRLHGYDYTQAGAYFLTICTHQRECLFGKIINGVMKLNTYGEIVATCWKEIPVHSSNAELDAMVIMPNHIHSILVIADKSTFVGAQHAAPLRRQQKPERSHVTAGSLGAMVRSFKSATTQRINAARQTPGFPVWQRNYHEHIIRDDREWNLIRQYIADNPLQWELDRENPASLSIPRKGCTAWQT